MEVEIARHTEEEVERRMTVLQQHRLMEDREGPWGEVGDCREEPGFGAQFGDVHVNVQGRQYVPPPFGRAGQLWGQ